MYNYRRNSSINVKDKTCLFLSIHTDVSPIKIVASSPMPMSTRDYIYIYIVRNNFSVQKVKLHVYLLELT